MSYVELTTADAQCQTRLNAVLTGTVRCLPESVWRESAWNRIWWTVLVALFAVLLWETVLRRWFVADRSRDFDASNSSDEESDDR